MEDKRILIFNSYEEFENHLRSCTQWDSNEGGPYDIIGITNFLSAILDNLSTNINQSEFKNIKEVLSNNNIEF